MMQTVPVGVAVADYQCADFDNGAFPSAWTLTQTAGGTAVISGTQAHSLPWSFHPSSIQDEPSVGALSWSKSGVGIVTRMDVSADVYRVYSKGFPGSWTGHIDLLCAGIGETRACLYYQGAPGFGVAYSTPTSRVNADTIADLPTSPTTGGAWSHIELQISSSGAIDMWVNGALEVNYNNNGAGFPASAMGTATVGLAQTGMTLGTADYYFDNVVAAVRR
jgi:hypothetical protein